MTLHNWQALGRQLEFDGHAVFYLDAPESANAHRKTLFLIHGFPTASWDWSRVWPELSERFRTIAPDMIGFGFSDKPRSYPYAIGKQADLFEVLARRLELEEVHLLAHDYGDTVAQELLARQQHGQLDFRILSTAFLNGGLFPESYRPRPIQKLLMSPLGPLLTPFVGRASLKRTFRRIFGPQTQPTEAELDDFWALIEHQNGKPLIPKLIRYMKERREQAERWTRALKEARVPLRLIDGAADPISGRAMAEYYHRLVHHPDVVLLEGIGHYPQWEAPEQVVRHYFDFMERVASASA